MSVLDESNLPEKKLPKITYIPYYYYTLLCQKILHHNLNSSHTCFVTYFETLSDGILYCDILEEWYFFNQCYALSR